MATTLKRRSVCMTKESERQLIELCSQYGENPSQVVIRALQNLHTLLSFNKYDYEKIENINNNERNTA